MSFKWGKIAFVFEGTLNKELFAEYLRICLVPTLGPDDVLVLDNSSVHTSKLVRDTLTELGITAVFLPVYSPDFFMKNLFAQPINNDFTTSIFYEIKPQFL